MADSDPPHEVDDREAPADRDVDTPDPGAFYKQVSEREQQHHGDQEGHAEAHEPSCRGRARQDDGADLVGNRAEGMSRLDDRRWRVRGDFFRVICHDLTALRLVLEFRVRVADFRQVRGPRTRVEIGQHTVVAVLRLQLRDTAIRIIDIAEDDGVRRARLLARGLQSTVFDLLFGPLGVDAMLGDALDAVRALLHDAATPHGNVGVAHHLVLLRVPVLEEQEIKAANFVWAVVRAVARAHAPVVDHVVQAFGAVQRGADRAHQFAGRVFALHARNRLEVGLGIVAIALVVRIDANPVHVTPPNNLLFADDGDIVLRLAGDHAVVTTDTSVHVDRHAPRVTLRVVVVRIQRELARRLLFLSKLWIFLVFRQGSFAEDGTRV